MSDQTAWLIFISAVQFSALLLLGVCGWPWARRKLREQERWYQRVLVHQLLIDIDPKLAVWLAQGLMVACALAGYLMADSVLFLVLGAALGVILPTVILKHLEQRRAQRLERQLVDGITTLASGVRAGLNLVQAFELLVRNATGPIRQEFSQMLREYQMGLDITHAMRNAAGRIGSGNYRLLFTALEMHRQRGGDMAQSLDRISDSIREIQRLEGKLDALTAQGRAQAWMMAVMPVAFFLILYAIDREGTMLMLTEPLGRVILLVACALMVAAYMWIRKIMAVDI